MSTTTLQDEILVGLTNDPRYPARGSKYALLSPYLPDLLLAAVGGELDAPFGIESFCYTKAAFLYMLTQAPDFPWPEFDHEWLGINEYYHDCADELEQIASDIESYMQHRGIVIADQLLTAANPPLSRELLLDYYAGRLTMRQLVTQQPGAFIPVH